MDHERSPRGNARRSGSGGASSAKHKSRGGWKKPIKVLHIDNPMRVKTSAAGFRALVQELTGRHADPSKYSPDDLDSGAAAPRGADASPENIVASPSPRPAAGSNSAAPRGGDYDYDGEDDGGGGFRSQLLLENNYMVFSPPTLLYDHHPHSKKLDSQGNMTMFGPNEAEQVDTTIAPMISVTSTPTTTGTRDYSQKKRYTRDYNHEYEDDHDNGGEGYDHEDDKDYGWQL